MNRSRRSSLRNGLAGAALVLVSLVATLGALELAVRAWRGNFSDWSNQIVAVRNPGMVDQGLTYDSQLGWVVTAGDRAMPRMDGPPFVLAIGDSFTYGMEVNDDQTWPFYLQELLRAKVENGGVPGYGIDLDVLRAERLVPALKPAHLVLSFIADDIRRMEMHRMWGRERPYFELENGALALRHVPVPPSPPYGSQLPWWEHWIGWSALVDMLRVRLVYDLPEYFGDHARALPRGAGEGLVCPLMQRLARLGVPTLVVAQYAPYGWDNKAYGIEAHRQSLHVLDCAAKAGLKTLDLFDMVDGAIRAGGRDAVFNPHADHQSPAGNRLTTGKIAAALAK
jgi:hypothetical protein